MVDFSRLFIEILLNPLPTDFPCTSCPACTPRWSAPIADPFGIHVDLFT